jgi:hypothetical protein
MLRTASCLLLALAATAGWAETVEERIKATDFSKSEQVFELAEWCAANKLPTKARQYYNQTLKLDRDHEGAQTALGRVRVGDRWVPAKDAHAAAPTNAGAPAVATRRPGSPGPAARDIAWDLSVPVDPEPASTFINTYIERMPRVANDSRDMDVSVATILMDEHLPKALPRLCAALLEPGFGDLYGASNLVMELLKRGEGRKARQLLPFLVKASERVADPEDLATFAFAVGMLKDKRVVPRLIELLDHADETVKAGAIDGLAAITLLPATQIEAERMRDWWARNHDVSDQETYRAQLGSDDPRVAIEAAKALYQERDRAIVPVLIRLLRSEDRAVCGEAIAVIKQITGNTWAYDPAGTPVEKKKRADELEKWWKEEQFRFRWISEIAADNATASAAVTVAVDPAEEWVRQLASVAGNEAAAAEARLIDQGPRSVPALLGGLRNPSRLVRRTCHGLLLKVTGHDLPFDAGATEDERQAQIAAWTAWAEQQKLLGSGDEAATEQ